MKNKFKKATAILLSFIMTFSILCAFPASFHAAETITSGDFNYIVNTDDTIKITKYTGSDTDVVIPDNIDGHKVVNISNYAFQKCMKIESIVIPYGITYIGNNAFDNCQSLRSVIIPESVTSIGDYAFFHCCNLSSITIPDSVKFLGEHTFQSCLLLDSLKIPYGVKKIGYAFCYGCEALSEVILPDSIKLIDEIAFEHCVNLQSINIPNSVATINASAFYNCPKMTSIRVPESVTEIGTTALGYVSKYDENNNYTTTQKIKNFIIYGYENTEAEYYARENNFKFVNICANEHTEKRIVAPSCTENGYTIYTCKDCGDTYLADFTPSLNHSLEVISETSSTCSSTGAIEYECRVCGYKRTKTLPKPPHTYEESIQDEKLTLTCTECGHSYIAGKGSEKIKSGDYYYTVLEDGTAEISKYIGSDINVIIPDIIDGRKVTDIGNYAFYNYNKIESIAIPNGVKSIGKYAFQYCNSLKSINIPDSVNTIGCYAFECCNSLHSIDIPDSVTIIEWYAFSYSGLYSISIPKGVNKIDGGVFLSCTNLTEVKIPDSVTSIEYKAFYECENLKSIDIPKSVTRIEEYAFFGCKNMTSAIIPKSVTNIEEDAFGYYYDYGEDYEYDIPILCKVENFTIYGYKNTAAEAYANKHRFNFVQISCTHNDMVTNVVDPTCTKKGYTIYTCNECGYTYKADYTNALGHSNEVISTTDATCTSTGSIEYKCKVCGYKHTKITPTTSHTYEETIIEPSCTQEGQKICRCTECGDTYTEVKPKLPHTYEERIIEPSCSQEGQKICRCTKCGDTYTEVIPTLAHSFVDTVIEPTDCTDGYTLHTCSVCGYEYTDEIVHIENPVHNFKNGVCTVCGTSDTYLYQSEHNYSPNTDKSWTVSRDGAFELNVTFSDETEVENMFDFIYIYDSGDNLVGEYTGTMLAGQTVTIKGNTAKIRLVTDGLNSDYYGFSLSDITTKYKGDVNGDGELTVTDVTDIQKDIADLIKFDENQKALADVNGDGDVDVNDVTILQKYIAGLIDVI